MYRLPSTVEISLVETGQKKKQREYRECTERVQSASRQQVMVLLNSAIQCPLQLLVGQEKNFDPLATADDPSTQGTNHVGQRPFIGRRPTTTTTTTTTECLDPRNGRRETLIGILLTPFYS